MNLTQKLKAYIELVIPPHFLIAITGLLAGIYLATGTINILESLFPVLIIGILMVSAFNSFNCIFDAKIDAVSKPNRPIPSGRISKREALLFTLSSYLLIIIGGFLLNNSIVFILIILNILTTLIYSAPYFRFKERFILTNLTVTAQYGFFPIVIGWSLYSNLFEFPLIVLTFSIFLALATSITENFGLDYIGDKKFNVRTLLVVFEPKIAGKIVSGLLLLPFALVGLSVLIGVLSNATLITLITLPIAFVMMKKLIAHPIDKEGEDVITYGAVLYIVTLVVFVIAYRGV